MRHHCIIIGVLIVLLSPANARADDGNSSYIPIVAPVSLEAPYQCGECSTSAPVLRPRAELEHQHLQPLDYLLDALWNAVSLPIICWMLGIYQNWLNAYSESLNSVYIPALNGIIFELQNLGIVVRNEFAALHGDLGDIYVAIWRLHVDLGEMIAYQAALLSTLGSGSSALLSAWIDLAMISVDMFGYMAGYAYGIVGALWIVLSDIQAFQPQQISDIESFWLLQALIGVFWGLSESELSWWWSAQIGLYYVAAGLGVLRQIEESTK